MSNTATLVAGLATLATDLKRAEVEVRKLKFHRSRVEPTDPVEVKARNGRRIALAESWLEQPLSDVIARDGDYLIADGNERVSGLLLLGVEKITAAFLPANTPDSKLDEISALTDFHKTTLTPYERALVAKRLLDAGGGTQGEMAARLRIDPGGLSRYLSLYDCIPKVREAAEAGRIGLSDWYAISRRADQDVALEEALHLPPKEFAQRNRQAKAARQRDGKPDESETETLESAKVTLPDAVIVVKARDLTLAKAAELLAAAQRAAEDGRNDGLSIKTFQDLTRDRAKKAAEKRKADEQKKAAKAAAEAPPGLPLAS